MYVLFYNEIMFSSNSEIIKGITSPDGTKGTQRFSSSRTFVKKIPFNVESDWGTP